MFLLINLTVGGTAITIATKIGKAKKEKMVQNINKTGTGLKKNSIQ
jgi:hypothetical protein